MNTFKYTFAQEPIKDGYLTTVTQNLTKTSAEFFSQDRITGIYMACDFLAKVAETKEKTVIHY